MFAEVCISLALVAMALFVFFAVRTRRTSSNRFSLLLAGIFVSSFSRRDISCPPATAFRLYTKE